MTTNFNHGFARNFIGMVAAVLIGGTFLVAATGPAVVAANGNATATNAVNFAANSNIVRSA